jgi:hypothetical protein
MLSIRGIDHIQYLYNQGKFCIIESNNVDEIDET